MSPELWRQARKVFEDALDREPAERGAFVDEACLGDPQLLAEVSSLLASHDQADDVFLSPIIDAVVLDRFEGRNLGPYRVLHRLGHGGMGAVYLAERADEQFRRRVAVKLIRPGFDDGHLMRRFSNERHMLAVLDHPNIVKLLDAGITEDGVPYFVMDYVEGQPIDEFCRTHGFSIPERLELFRTVCAAVHYAHRNLVVHRDLKPGNILVTPEGTPKLLDFGIAKLLRPEYGAGAIGLTRTMQPMTPEYASPEQVLGQPITTSSDVYSLGVLLYRLIAGRHPYEMSTLSAAEMERVVCETNPDRPSAAATSEAGGRRLAASDVDNIVLMAMRKEPQRRYPSAEHLSEDIRRYLANQPVAARPDTWAYRGAKFISRHRIGAGGSLVAAIVLFATAIEIWHLRTIAETRDAELRRTANFMLNTLEPELRNGVTAARKSLVTGTVGILDRMARDARKDEELKYETADGYHQIGDILGNPSRSHTGGDGAAESYRKELTLGNTMKPGPKASFVIARAHVGLGRVAAFSGARSEARDHFQTAMRFFAGAGDSMEAKRGFRSVAEQLGKLYEAQGDIQAASESYAKSLEYARELDQAQHSHKTQSDVLAESFLVGFAMARAGHTNESLITVRNALAIARGLAASNASNRRDEAAAAGLLGYVLQRAGRSAEAIAAYQDAIAIFEQLAEEDPKSQLTRIDLGQTEGEFADVLWAAGQKGAAREASGKAVKILQPVADARSAYPYVLVAYAGFLLSKANAHRDDAAALRYVERADQAEKPPTPETQQILAAAYAANGNMAKARATAQKALDSLASGADPLLRNGLKDFLKPSSTRARE